MSNILVAYFTAEGGNTAKLAERIAKAAGADLFEIKPETPYTEADLRWTNPLARCNREKLGKKDVPVAGTVENWADYDTVLIGFPIWYYAAPNIIQTFVKQYDFTGKHIALFATSGSSGIGKTAEKLTPYLNGKGTLTDAKRFDTAAPDDEIQTFVKTVCEK